MTTFVVTTQDSAYPRTGSWSDIAAIAATAAQGAKADAAAPASHDHDAQYAPLVHAHPGGSEAFPVGAVFISVVATDPGTLLGYGTWSAFGAGRVLVGFNAADTDFDTAEEIGGAKTVTLTGAQSGIAQHTHTQNAHTHDFLPRSATTGAVSSIVTGTLDTSSTISGANQPHIQAQTAVNQNAGPTNAAEAHSNVQPYITVHMWKRTA